MAWSKVFINGRNIATRFMVCLSSICVHLCLYVHVLHVVWYISETKWADECPHASFHKVTFVCKVGAHVCVGGGAFVHAYTHVWPLSTLLVTTDINTVVSRNKHSAFQSFHSAFQLSSQSIGGLQHLFCQCFRNKCCQKYEFYRRKGYQKWNAIHIKAIMSFTLWRPLYPFFYHSTLYRLEVIARCCNNLSYIFNHT